VLNANHIKRLIRKLTDATRYAWKVDHHSMECRDGVFMNLIGEDPSEFVVDPAR
jgi:S-ribosylhomocysteine lyase LuxS involved in autoinducer biosynthesis